MKQDYIMETLIHDLSEVVDKFVPKLFGQPVINVKKELTKNKEEVLRWLQRNQHLISQL